ncbi:MAG: universal stress protein [Gemmataceae bacterium]|nr:universal stress protein [Gemmataceae bacterium]
MFRKILMPVDLSDKHQRALDAAADLADRDEGEVTLLHIIELIPGLSVEEERPFYQRLECAGRAHLDRLGAVFAQRGLPWRAEILYGHRGPDVVRYATEQQVDLILLTAPVLDPAHPATGLGSLSYKVSLFAPCPVLLIR